MAISRKDPKGRKLRDSLLIAGFLITLLGYLWKTVRKKRRKVLSILWKITGRLNYSLLRWKVINMNLEVRYYGT